MTNQNTKARVNKDSNKGLHTSQLLLDILEQQQGEKVYFRNLLLGLGDRAFGWTLFICSLPEALPLPIAGVSAIIGIPLVLVSGQLVLGFRKPWLPKWIGDRSFKRKDFEKIVRKSLPYLNKVEHLIRPRWEFMISPAIERLLGVIIFILAIVITLPIPFGNFLPAIVVVLISLGILEKDGMAIAIGILGSFVIFGLLIGAVFALRSIPLPFVSGN
ncbi:MAG: exopolysaccharide biosynthesis protein [Xenococcaceae cyanobacterium]